MDSWGKCPILGLKKDLIRICFMHMEEARVLLILTVNCMWNIRNSVWIPGEQSSLCSSQQCGFVSLYQQQGAFSQALQKPGINQGGPIKAGIWSSPVCSHSPEHMECWVLRGTGLSSAPWFPAQEHKRQETLYNTLCNCVKVNQQSLYMDLSHNIW